MAGLSRSCFVWGACLAGILSGAVRAEERPYADPPWSMGQPARYRIGVGVSTGYGFRPDTGLWRVFGNVTPEGYFPHLGIDLASIEAGFGAQHGEYQAELGYFVRVPYFRGGVEYNFRKRKLTPVLTIQYALRRGGIFGSGEEIRLDYRPGESELLAGIVINQPQKKYRATRPAQKYVRIPRGHGRIERQDATVRTLPPELERSVQRVEHSIVWLDRLLTPRIFVKESLQKATEYRNHIRIPGHTFEAEDAAYHRGLVDAFTFVAEGDTATGDQLAAMAERLIFEDILVPYNRLFGQNKRPWQPTGFVETALESFDAYLSGHSRFALLKPAAADRQRALAHEVFRRTVRAIGEAAESARTRWRTTFAIWQQAGRFTWLPLNYGLRPDDYDTQQEWDAIAEMLTERKFSDANLVKYLPNEQFHYELKRTIVDTERYHVVIIHDFQNETADGGPDPKSWDIIINGYMRAMADAVRAIDRGERDVLPQFMMFIDQNFYQGNGERPIITVLENIYKKSAADVDDDSIRRDYAAMHEELIEAIAVSPHFSALGEERLRKLFKVHVSVTNPWDPAFAFDISMRDHRKIVFHDVFEDDPASGEGVLTGTGVGEHYQPPGWEDRAIAIRGPALVELKRSARRLCLSQGYRDHEIPAYLRDAPYPSDYEERCDALRERGWRAHGLITMNETGFGDKKATVLRAMLYNLAPKGSVLVAIDSLWLSDFWAEMFLCAALRGVHVYAVAPSPANAPASGQTVLQLMRETLGVLLVARDFVAEDLERSGGSIHVGLYAHQFGVDDARRRGEELLGSLDKHPFIHRDFPVHPGVRDLIRQRLRELPESEFPVREDDVRPYLHMKTQFFGTRAGMKVLELSEWVSIADRYMAIRRQQALGEPNEGLTPLALVGPDGDPVRERFQREYLAIPEEEREAHLYAFTVGSFNQDRRGMISDGEVLAVLTGYDALIGVLDVVLILATSEWPEDVSTFEELFPDPGLRGTIRNITRYLQDMF